MSGHEPEPRWQPLVVDALAVALGLEPELLHREVRTRDGSIVDVLYAGRRRLIGFELKMAAPGEVLAPLDARALRQLRHYRAGCDAVYLVTLAAPRPFLLTGDGRVLAGEPLERQALPDGVGWVLFDRFGWGATILVPAPELEPSSADRAFIVDQLEARLARVRRSAMERRA